MDKRALLEQVYENSFSDELIKLSDFGDITRKVFGYHDLKEVSKTTGIPKKDVVTYYHGLRAPNRMLYSKENVAKDIKNIWTQREKYNKARQKVKFLDTKPGGKEEAAILKTHGKSWDKMLGNLLKTRKGLMTKYRDLKN